MRYVIYTVSKVLENIPEIGKNIPKIVEISTAFLYLE